MAVTTAELLKMLKETNHVQVDKPNAIQASHRLEKYLNLDGFLEKSLKIEPALKSTGKSLIGKSLEFYYFCST